MSKQNNFSRREFLKTTVALTASPYIIPSSAWSAENKALPGDRITLGHIGMGTQNRGLITESFR